MTYYQLHKLRIKLISLENIYTLFFGASYTVFFILLNRCVNSLY